jgi:hypothetical protein
MNDNVSIMQLSTNATSPTIIYPGNSGGINTFSSFDPTTNMVYTIASNHGAACSRNISNNSVSCPKLPGGNNSTLYALNASTGAIVWSFNMIGKTGGGHGTGVTTTNDLVFTGDGNHTFYALNATTGAILWTLHDANGGYSPPPNIFWSWGAPSIVDGMVFETTLGTSTAGTLEAYAPYILFNEAGLPANTLWKVTFDARVYSSSNTTIRIPVFPPGNNSWTVSTPINGAAGIRYAALKSSGNVFVPLKIAPRNIAFNTQFNVNVAKSPKTGGSISPSSKAWYTSGSVVALTETPNPGYVFGKWVNSTSSIVISNASTKSTTAKVNGPGTITAKFSATVALVPNSTVGSVLQGSSVGISANVSGGAQSVTLGNSTDLPSGVTLAFSQNPVNNSPPGVMVTITISTSAATPVGFYKIMIRAIGKNHAAAGATYNLTVT